MGVQDWFFWSYDRTRTISIKSFVGKICFMRYNVKEELDVYEIFMKYGFEDGDHPLARDVCGRVYWRLTDLGWTYRDIQTLHNSGYIDELTSPDGKKYELSEFWDYAEAWKVREGLIKLEIPEELIESFDELNRQEITRLFG